MPFGAEASVGAVSRLCTTWGATVRGTYPTPEAGTRTQYVQYAGPWASRPALPVRTQRGRLVRVARTYPTEAPGRTCQPGTARAWAGRPSPG